jgi:hypothetical protein
MAFVSKMSPTRDQDERVDANAKGRGTKAVKLRQRCKMRQTKDISINVLRSIPTVIHGSGIRWKATYEHVSCCLVRDLNISS